MQKNFTFNCSDCCCVSKSGPAGGDANVFSGTLLIIVSSVGSVSISERSMIFGSVLFSSFLAVFVDEYVCLLSFLLFFVFIFFLVFLLFYCLLVV